MTARYHRVAAESALRDYSRFAATEFARRADDALTNATLWTALRPAMGLATAAPCCAPRRRRSWPTPPSGRAASTCAPPARSASTSGSCSTERRRSWRRRGRASSPALQRWIADTVRASATHLATTNRYFASLTGSPDGQRCSCPTTWSARACPGCGRRTAWWSPKTTWRRSSARRRRRPWSPSRAPADCRTTRSSRWRCAIPPATCCFARPRPSRTPSAADSGLGWQQAHLVARVAVRPEGGAAHHHRRVAGLPAAVRARTAGADRAAPRHRRLPVAPRGRAGPAAQRLRRQRVARAAHAAGAESACSPKRCCSAGCAATRAAALAGSHPSRKRARLAHLVDNLLAATRDGGSAPTGARWPWKPSPWTDWPVKWWMTSRRSPPPAGCASSSTRAGRGRPAGRSRHAAAESCSTCSTTPSSTGRGPDRPRHRDGDQRRRAPAGGRPGARHRRRRPRADLRALHPPAPGDNRPPAPASASRSSGTW